MTSFDLTGPLPLGTTVLEASAGTGKTYAIVGLATRFVAEGVADISQVLLVTFGKGATEELRERARTRFAQVAADLADPDAARNHRDELVAHLAATDDAEVELRRYRLLKALSEFDSGTIATTHSFCQRMLDGLGIAGEREPEATFVESVDDVVTEVVDDLYLRAYSGTEGDPLVTVRDAHAACRAAVHDRRAHLSPEAPEETPAGQRVMLAAAARTETERRKRLRGIRDFDDLLELLHQVLTDPVHGTAACERVRNKFTVVLVDEFQDTDPLQWSILRNAFHGHGVLVLVGDPKQAIYAFRGAEVLSYLEAVRLADRHLVLSTNWRSDEALVRSLGHLYEGASLGHPDIVVGEVGSVHADRRISGSPPLRLRVLPRTGMGPLNRTGFPSVPAVRARVARDVAEDIVALLAGNQVLTTDAEPRPLAPGDIAVLVRTGKQSEMVRAELDRAGVPSVLRGGSSVFLTDSAGHWLRVLHALEQPHRADAVRRAALTPLLGWTAAELDAGGDEATSQLSNRLRDWAALFTRSGFAAVVENLSTATELQSRLLAVDSGERHLTDLRHLAQLIDRESVEHGHGLTALHRWLSDRVADPGGGSITDRSRRLDSDAAAVQIATIHSSKGLEYPVVYVPYGWDGAKNPNPSTLLFHDESGRRVLDVGGKDAAGYSGRKLDHEREELGEELRLLYVALTRAQCRIVAWWAPTAGTSASPLHRLLFGRLPGESEPEPRPKVHADSPQWTALTERAGEFLTLEPVLGHRDATAQDIGREYPEGELAAAVFDRYLDYQWRRTSYSALTAGAHDAAAASAEQEDASTTDEPTEDSAVAADSPRSAEPSSSGVPSPMNGLPAGAAFGTLVHEILEYVDTSAEDLDAEVRGRCREAVSIGGADLDADRLAAALSAVLRTPLGFAEPGSAAFDTLGEFPPSDRLSELDFELPLAGGDRPEATSATVRGIAELLDRHLPADDALAPYARAMLALDDRALRGYLTGSIDTVLRVGSGAADDLRFVVVDYKTNRITAGDLTTENFTRPRMAEEMMHAHYPLQALLYSVALHRYLRWRLPGYRPEQHLGGVQYHFVRGMVGPQTPPGCGIFDWHPPTALVTDLSDFLAAAPEVTAS